MILAPVALLASGLFAGAALYITVVEHPARRCGGTTLAVTEFRPSYRRAAWMQASLAAVGGIAGLAAGIRDASTLALVAGLLLVGIIAFTLIVIRPTNHRLLDPALDPASAEAARLLGRWGRLHAVRAAAGLVAFVLLGLQVAGGR